MPITLHTVTNFNTLRERAIRLAESLHPRPINIGDDTITYGWGFTFLRKSTRNGVDTWLRYEHLNSCLAAIGITLSENELEDLDRIGEALTANHLNGPTGARQRITDFIARWNQPAQGRDRPNLTDDRARLLFNADMDFQSVYLSDRLRGLLGATEGQRVYDSLLGTREMVAVFTNFYNGQKLFGQGIANALSEGNRAEAWFQLRYGWKESIDPNPRTNPNNGWAKRHYMESTVFGLYNDPANISLDDAKDAFRMLQLHRGRIRQYEKLYDTQVGLGNNDYRTLLSDPQIAMTIPALSAAMDPAKYVLLAQLRQENSSLADLDITAFESTNIYFDPGRDLDTKNERAIGTVSDTHTALLSAVKYDSANAEYASKDILIGEGGNDYLVGGKGDDILLGGEGRDLYYYRMGDGNDRVIDADGGLLVIHADTYDLYVSGNFTKKADADEWTQAVTGSDRAVHTVTLSHGATWQMRLDDGAIIDLGQGDDLKRFGIQLNLGTLPDPGSPTLVGDPQIHFKAAVVQGSEPANWVVVRRSNEQPIKNESGEQTGVKYDAEYFLKDPATGNPTEPGGPAYDDTLAGTSNADFIRGLLGNDSIAGNAGGDRLEGGEGDDQLHGNDQDDTLLGGAGSDMLHGDAGKDRLFAQAAVSLDEPGIRGDYDTAVPGRGDLLSGGADDDILIGAAADDMLAGGMGIDLMYGGAGDDLLSGDVLVGTVNSSWNLTRTPDMATNTYRWVLNQGSVSQSDSVGGDDMLYGGGGVDWVFGGAGNDLVDGGTGEDVLFGDAGNDVVLGGAGKDVMNGDDGDLAVPLQGNDWLDGGDGDDSIWGMAGADVLIGGKGNDTMYGGAGRDTYIYNKGDGVDYVVDDDKGSEKSIVILGAGVSKDDFKLRKGSLLLDFSNGDALHIENFNADDPLSNASIEAFQFADGSSLSWGDLLARGFDLDGTEGDDTIVGTGIEDRIDGKAGNDLIWGSNGNDVLTGGTGTDGLNGGLGDDVYVFSAGDAATMDGTATGVAETLAEEGGQDTIRFTAGVDPQQLVLLDNLDGSLVIDYSAQAQPLDRLLIHGGLAGDIERFEVGAGDDPEGVQSQARNFSYTQFVGEFGDGIYRGTDADGHEHASGGRGSDDVGVSGGGNQVSGGKGNDTVRAFGLNNTIHYSAGDGTDTVWTNVSGNPGNVLRLGGIDASQLRLGLDASRHLVVTMGDNADDRMVFQRFDATNVAAIKAFDHIEFDDGSTLSYDQLMAKGLDIFGGDAAEIIEGTNVDDRISGLGGDDRIDGLAGNDVLAGEGGDDILSGGVGDDSYRFAAGSGKDTVIDAAGFNAVEFGAGLTLAMMAASQGIGIDGRRYLDLDFGNGDRLSIQNGELNRVQSFRFGDGTMLATSDLLAAMPAVTLVGESSSESLRGYAGNDMLLGQAGDDVLEGGAGSDLLDGGSGNDTVRGGDGTDWLNGGGGIDQLLGGSGVDTYVFGAGSGQVAIVESTGEQSVLTLAAGASALSLRPVREGGDLLLSMDNGGDVLRIAGYYDDAESGSNWQVQSADGTISTMTEFIAVAGQTPQTVAAAYEKYRDSVRGDVSAHLLNQGYQSQADGSWSSNSTSVAQSGPDTHITSVKTSMPGIVFEAETQADLQTAWAAPRWESTGEQTVTVLGSAQRFVNSDRLEYSGPSTPYFVPAGSINHYYVPVKYMRLANEWERKINEATSHDPGANHDWWLDYRRALQLNWEPPPGATAEQMFDGNGAFLGVWVYPPSAPVPTTETMTLTSNVSTTTVTIPELTLGAGNDEVGLYAHGMVDGGMGDDSLHAAFFVDGGHSYPSWGMSGGGLLYGNDGNDYLSGASGFGLQDGDNILIGGRGRDVLTGGGGADTFMLLEEDSVDYITDTGSALGYRIDWRNEGELIFANPELFSIAGNEHAALEAYYGSYIRPDSVIFGAGTSASSVSVFMSDSPQENQGPWYEPVLQIMTAEGTGAQITLARADDAAGTGIEYVQFGDGTRQSIGQVLARRDQSQNVLGTLGRDVIRTGAGDDRIDGGASGDLLAGGAGNDTYVIRRNTGFDTIDQGNALPGDADVIEFAADVAPADVALSMDETGLNLRIAGSGSGAKLLGWTGNDSNLSVRFSDGTVWDAATLQSLLATVRGSTGADSLIGTGGNDILLGYEGGDSLNAGGGDDLLDGGPGNDILMGGAGDDTYLFGRSSGSDFILASGSLVSDRDVVRLDPDIAPADVFLSRQSFGVLLALDGSAATLSIGNGLSTPSIQFADGTVWGAAVLNAAPILGTALAETLAGGNVGETILGVGGNDFLFGHGGDDVLDGGAGDDLLDGGSGNDVYLFGRGSGHDHIQQYSASIGDLDRIRFGAGIAASDVTAVRDSFGLHFTLVDSGETLDAGLPNGAMFASVEFADGTVWDSTSLAALPITLQGSAVIDNLVGTSGNDRILGLAGDDRLYGEAGDDLLLGGDGDDLLFGGDGNDELQGGRGADLLYGGPGATKLRFDRGDGADQVFPGALDATIGYTLSFGAGVTSSEIRVTKDSSFVTVSIEGSGDSVSFYQGNGVLLPAVEFESGAYWSPQYVDYLLHTVGTAGSDELVGGGDADVLQGFAGNDELQGQGGADTLVGGAGSDRLDGGAGNDVYLYSRGDGSDTLVLSGNGEDEVDTLRFAADIAPGDVAVFAAEEGGESLVIDLGSAGGDGGEGEAPRDRITLQDWFEVGSRGLRVEFGDGTVWDAATLTEMGTPPVREIIGTAGNDEIDGSEAREVIHGLAGNDELYGGGGDDTLTGGTGNDYISGGSGHDVIDFARGDGWDELGLYESPDDSDIIRMGEGIRQEDVVVGRRGDDLLLLLADGDEGISVRWWFEYPTGLASVEFQDGSHWDAASLAEMADESELIFGSAWGDELFGTRYDDHIIGLGGNDVLEGYAGNDILIGGTGNDVAFGGGGADFLVGGSGVDSLWGGEGADTYLYRLGDGWDEINSWALSGEDESPVGGDIIRFGLGILPGGVSVAARQFDGEVVIELEAGGGDGGEGGGGGLRVFGDLDYLPSVSFADGTVISPEQLLDLAAAWVGSEDSDVLIGTAADDHIVAGAGDDVLYGRDGDDVLAGGADFDRLRGGRGDDVYLFGLGDGEDIIDTRDGGADVIRFGAGISVGDLIFGDYNEGEGYRIGNLETDDTIVVLADAASLPAVEFADGTTWTRDELLAKFWSHAPMLEDEVEAQSAVAGETFELAVDADLFWDPDQWAGDTLSYRAMQADGSPLPGWLGFDAESLSFSGVPGSGDGGELDVRLVATDRAGNQVAAEFILSVESGNHAPVVLAPSRTIECHRELAISSGACRRTRLPMPMLATN